MNMQFPPRSPHVRIVALIVAPLLVLAVIFAVWWKTEQEPAPQRTVTAVGLPAGMPTHFSFGVGSGLRGVADLNETDRG